MASVVKIKRSAVQGKAPTTSDIETGELALNTRDGKLYSTDGSTVFEVGANLPSLRVSTGGLTVGNSNPFSFPTNDGAALQILQTDGNGNLAWVSLEAAEGGGFTSSTLSSYPTGDYADGGAGTETYLGSITGDQGTDPFGVSLGVVYDCMDPQGRYVTEDLGALT